MHSKRRLRWAAIPVGIAAAVALAGCTPTELHGFLPGFDESGQPTTDRTEMVSGLYYEHRRESAKNASDRDMKEAAEAHRRIYQAIRARDVKQAREAMNQHLLTAQAFQAAEATATTTRRRA